MQIPEGKQTVTAEGGDLRSAIATAASELSIHPSQVDHKLDLSHFRSELGTSVSKSTVKIIAWESGRDIDEAPPKKERKKSSRSDDDGGGRGRGDDRKRRSSRGSGRSGGRGSGRSGGRSGGRGRGSGRRDDRRGGRSERRGAADGETEASEFAAEWFEATLKFMNVDGEVTATGDDERVHVAVSAERAGRVVGKRGATLRAIRHLLGLAIEQQFGEHIIDVDVGDDRPRDERSSRDRDDRKERRRGRGNRRGRESKHPEEKLRALARRAADKAIETGQTITINLKLNSYDRRLMHLEISDIDGVDSHSEEREEDGDLVKYIQVIPDED